MEMVMSWMLTVAVGSAVSAVVLMLAAGLLKGVRPRPTSIRRPKG